MRALISSFIGLVLVLIAFGNAVAAEEEILSFHSEITIHEDATVTIVETILVRATGNKIRRGIYRDFPTVYKDRYGNTVRVGFEVLRALRDTDRVNHWVESIPGGKRVYMGHKDRFISPGQYAFQLTYKTDQQVSFYEDFDELAWNATGDQWDFPILKAVTEIHLPPGATVREKVVYTGRYGSKEQSAIAESASPRTARFQSTRVLNPGEGMTVAVSWPKGFVKEPTKAEGFRLLLKANADLAAAVAGLIVVVAYYLIAWAYVGRDPKAGTIIPRFKPPDGLSPAAMRYLVQTKFDDATFSVAIVSLAVKGVIRIEEAGGTYTLFKESNDWGELSEGEISVAKELFAYDRTSISLEEANHVSIGLARDNLELVLEQEVDEAYLKENRGVSFVGILLSFLAVGFTLYCASLVGPDEHPTAGLAMIFAPIVGIFRPFGILIIKLVVGLAFRGAGKFLIYIAGGAIVLGLVYSLVQASSSWFVFALVIIISVVPVVFTYLLKAPTVHGRLMLDKVQGFKLYLSVAEKHRLEALYPPQETPELFEKYMPYAIALGVGDIWSKRFADHLAASSAEADELNADRSRLYRPRWYSSRHWTRRSLSGLGTNLGTPFAKSVGLAATPPASTSRDSFTGDSDGFSSGGFSGGFGGGGFSGGGGGGGGGGGF